MHGSEEEKPPIEEEKPPTEGGGGTGSASGKAELDKEEIYLNWPDQEPKLLTATLIDSNGPLFWTGKNSEVFSMTEVEGGTAVKLEPKKSGLDMVVVGIEGNSNPSSMDSCLVWSGMVPYISYSNSGKLPTGVKIFRIMISLDKETNMPQSFYVVFKVESSTVARNNGLKLKACGSYYVKEIAINGVEDYDTEKPVEVGDWKATISIKTWFDEVIKNKSKYTEYMYDLANKCSEAYNSVKGN